jgi:arsenite-transporting ATPase
MRDCAISHPPLVNRAIAQWAGGGTIWFSAPLNRAIAHSRNRAMGGREAPLRPKNSEFASQVDSFKTRLDSLADRKVLFVGGKGGVGKTTISSLAALHFSKQRDVTVFSTDPASNLDDVFEDARPRRLRVESVDAQALYRRFLGKNLESFLEIADRGTYLDRDELKRLFELSIPGIDELMAWMRVGELSNENRLVIVDTAPTGHTLRMLSSSEHFRQFEEALSSMQAKHVELVETFSGRRVRDAMDEFLREFESQLNSYRATFTDPQKTSLIAVLLSEELVIAQTRRLISEVKERRIDVPFAVLNQSAHDCDCDSCRQRERMETQIELGVPLAFAPRACVQLDSVARMRSWLQGKDQRFPGAGSNPAETKQLDLGEAHLVFFAGKGGVGKTSTSSSVALQKAARFPDARFTLISVDPAHSIRDVFAGESPPANLNVETIDTRAEWNRLRESLGHEIRRAVNALTPRNVSIAHDTDILEQLIRIAPPGADELFAIMRLWDLINDQDQRCIFVDTAPTGHFLRLLELPETASEWVHEFMRILLKYKSLIPPGSLGEQLVRASKALSSFREFLHSDKCTTVVVTRPERIILEETGRLISTLKERQMRIAGTVANYLTPANDCSCDQSRRAGELDALTRIEGILVIVERRPDPPVRLADLQSLIPLQ